MLEEGSSKKLSNTFTVSGHVQVYKLPKNFTYAKFRALSAKERKKYLALEGPNLVVNGGADQIVNLMVAANTNAFTKCAVGSSVTAVAASQTALVAQIGSQLTITSAYLESIGKAHFDTFFSSTDNNGTWRESGIFTTGAVMLCRKTFNAFVKSSSNTAVIAWTITLTPI